MKIALFSMPDISLGKCNIKDERLDQVDKITKSKKKVYIQADLIGADKFLDADVVLVAPDSRADLILADLDFVENRLSKTSSEEEKSLLNRFREVLEKEEFISSLSLNEEEKKIISGYGLITLKPVITAGQEDLNSPEQLIFDVFKKSGFISFFTTGEKESRAWLIRNAATAWEASGAIHSDIQKGFIRAEIISFDDFIKCGGETGAKQAGKLRLEQKNYIMQDCDLVNFRFNK